MYAQRLPPSAGQVGDGAREPTVKATENGTCGHLGGSPGGNLASLDTQVSGCGWPLLSCRYLWAQPLSHLTNMQ